MQPLKLFFQKHQKFLIFIMIGGLFLFSYWEDLLLFVLKYQNILQRELRITLQSIQKGESAYLIPLMGSAFAYGVLHSISAGHGKAIILALAQYRPEPLYLLRVSIISAYLQMLSAMFWILITVGLLKWLLKDSLSALIWINRVSFLLIMATGVYLLYRPEQCCCGHHAMMAIGFRPCAGSLMILMLAFNWNIPMTGFWLVFFIATGTAFTTSLVALFGLKLHHQLPNLSKISAIFLIVFGFILLMFSFGFNLGMIYG